MGGSVGTGILQKQGWIPCSISLCCFEPFLYVLLFLLQCLNIEKTFRFAEDSFKRIFQKLSSKGHQHGVLWLQVAPETS